MIQRIEPQALMKQAADYFRLCEAELTRKRGRYRQERALVKLLHRYSGLKVSVVYRSSRRLERFERLELFERFERVQTFRGLSCLIFSLTSSSFITSVYL